MADAEHRKRERAVLSGDMKPEELKQYRLARGLCPFCGSKEVEEWGRALTRFTDGGIPIEDLPPVDVQTYICLGCAGPSMLAMHWATYEVKGVLIFTNLTVVALMKPGRYGVQPKLGKAT